MAASTIAFTCMDATAAFANALLILSVGRLAKLFSSEVCILLVCTALYSASGALASMFDDIQLPSGQIYRAYGACVHHFLPIGYHILLPATFLKMLIDNNRLFNILYFATCVGVLVNAVLLLSPFPTFDVDPSNPISERRWHTDVDRRVLAFLGGGPMLTSGVLYVILARLVRNSTHQLVEFSQNLSKDMIIRWCLGVAFISSMLIILATISYLMYTKNTEEYASMSVIQHSCVSLLLSIEPCVLIPLLYMRRPFDKQRRLSNGCVQQSAV